MPRRKLSELRAKQVVCDVLGLKYEGWDNPDDLKSSERYVVKVDQATKKRFKNGLIRLDASVAEIKKWIKTVSDEKGFEHFIIEPYKQHEATDERYISITRDKNGTHITHSRSGGVDIEDNQDSLHTVTVDDSTDWKKLVEATGFTEDQLKGLVKFFTANYFTLLEINPYLVIRDKIEILDVAIEVDDAAQLLQDVWSENDLRQPPRVQTAEELDISKLNEKSPASLAYQTIDSNGSLFVLLSGGGASVVVCDEIYNAGYGDKLANYGEYSGNPTGDEVYMYTSAAISAMLRSNAKKKAMFIGGAVANFTDIEKTFDGICRAIDKYGDDMSKQRIHVVVRRGGPNQVKGLARIKAKLDEYSISNVVYDQKTPIDVAVNELIRGIE